MMLPAAPLRSLIAARGRTLRAADQWTDEGMGALARHLAARFGGQAESWERLLSRIRSGEVAYIRDVTADRLAIGCNSHPVLIWPEEWLAEAKTRRSAA